MIPHGGPRLSSREHVERERKEGGREEREMGRKEGGTVGERDGEKERQS